MELLRNPQVPSSASEGDVVARITVELGPRLSDGPDPLAIRLRREAAGTGNELLRVALLSFANRLDSISKRDEPSSGRLVEAIERAGRLSCVYYACGTCDSDNALVCCYYDPESPPVCWCEAC